jgi:hypothetical protein
LEVCHQRGSRSRTTKKGVKIMPPKSIKKEIDWDMVEKALKEELKEREG